MGVLEVHEGILEESVFDASKLEGRIAGDPQAMLAKLLPFQTIPCPWGDLTIGEYYDEFGIVEHVPLGLQVGCGLYGMSDTTMRGLVGAESIGRVIDSDTFNPARMHEDYIVMDLKRPDQMNLGGARVHMIGSCAVFMNDGWTGATWRSREEMRACAEGLFGLLFPGGIFAMDTAEYGFPNGVLLEAGFRDCNIALWDAGHSFLCQLYQKPF